MSNSNSIRLITVILTLFMVFVLSIQAQDTSPALPVWSPVEGDGTLRRINVPVLMYHYVSELPEDADDIRRGLTLAPDIFREHIAYLSANGYQTVSLNDVDQALEYGTSLPDKPVVLTFDDGYLDAYTEVFPVLRDYGMTGTFFIITQFADERREGYMNWEQIAEMADAGMHMEGHSKTHPSLRERDLDYLVYQVLGSLESVTFHTERIARIFSYPIGHYDVNTLRFMASTPVERAVTTQPGIRQTTDNRYEVPRLRITDTTGIAGLAYLLNYPE
ncbi:MAG: polysaccharide deacetylase family protein [Anaerolineae bacterium]